MTARRTGRPAGWVRANRGGLIGLVPAALLAVVPLGWGNLRDYRQRHPGPTAVSAPGGWVQFAGGRMRLVGIEPRLPEASGYGGGAPVAITIGVVPYRFAVAFDAPTPKAFASCRIYVQGTDGRRWSWSRQATGAAFTGDWSCLPADADGTFRGRESWTAELTAYLPVGARPEGVRVELLNPTMQYVVLRAPAPSGSPG